MKQQNKQNPAPDDTGYGAKPKGDKMNALIIIQLKQIGNEEVNAVDARDLHSRLGVKKDFSDWIKNNIKKLNLVENVDFMVFPQKGENLLGGRPLMDYLLTLDAGKHIAMMTNTETAHEVRTYFIEFEKKVKKALSTLAVPPSNIDMFKLALAAIEDTDKKATAAIQTAGNAEKKANYAHGNAVQALDLAQKALSRVNNISDVLKTREDFCTIAGYCRINSVSMTSQEMSGMGKLCRKKSEKAGIEVREIFDPRWGKVGLYHFDILDECFSPKM